MNEKRNLRLTGQMTIPYTGNVMPVSEDGVEHLRFMGFDPAAPNSDQTVNVTVTQTPQGVATVLVDPEAKG